MQPQIPTSLSNQDEFNKNLARVLANNLTGGTATSWDASGYPLTYKQDNISGCIIRIGSLANPNALPNAWVGNNVDTTITHNLGKIPYGFIVIGKFATADVFFGTVAPTEKTVTLQTTNDATDITILLLAN